MKKFFQAVHLYLGLISGLIITITCFTGAILVFEDELQKAFYPQRYSVSIGEKFVPIQTMIDNLKKVEPDAKVSSVKIDANVQKTVSIRYEDGLNNEAFLNPYTGQVIETYSYKKSFFFTMFALHRWLLADDIGKLIVGTSTIFFLFILASGIVIWWRPNKAFLQQRLKFRFTKNTQLLNYNSHVILGFYCSIFLFIYAFTGLAWSFEWFNKGIYVVTNSSMKKIENPQSKLIEGQQATDVDTIFRTAQKTVPENKLIMIDLPKENTDSFRVSTITKNSLHYSAYDYLYFDQYSGNLISTLKYQDRNLGQKVRSSFKPIHTSGIFGLPSKLIGFVVCVLGTIFPITGTMIWFNKLRRKNKAKKVEIDNRVLNKEKV